jgi:hypothetical protein
MNTTVEKVVSIFTGITVLAIVAVIVGSPNSANLIRAWGSAYSSSIRAARGS